MDLGHEVLHQVRNNIHSHEHTDHHHIHDHNVLLKTDTNHNNTSDTETSLPFYSYFLFFQRSPNFTQEWNSTVTSVSSELIMKLHCGYITPLTPPPLLLS